MPETYALHEGAFGRAVVLELRDDLVAHAHAETQLALWLGGAVVLLVAFVTRCVLSIWRRRSDLLSRREWRTKRSPSL